MRYLQAFPQTSLESVLPDIHEMSINQKEKQKTKRKPLIGVESAAAAHQSLIDRTYIVQTIVFTILKGN